MDKKRILLYTLAFAAFAVLVYMQFRTWRNFDWATFWRESGNLGRPPHIFHLFHAVALIYVAYFMRALRWKIFLRPVRPQASPGSWLVRRWSVSLAWPCWDVPVNSSAPI